MAGFEQLATSLGSFMFRAGAVAAAVVCMWQFFKVILAGQGAERALMQACLTLVVAGVALAALANPLQTWSIFALLGATIYQAVFAAAASKPTTVLDVLMWVFTHLDVLFVGAMLALAVVSVAAFALTVLLFGARVIAAVWVWKQALTYVREKRSK